jgi:hypothetical protein
MFVVHENAGACDLRVLVPVLYYSRCPGDSFRGPFTQFSSAIRCLPVIARAFARVAGRRLADVKGVVKLLKVPSDDGSRVIAALPADLKSALDDGSFPSRLYAWVRRLLVERPGFLYDELWAATFLGLKLAGFGKVRGLFGAALYKGVFTLRNSERWWRAC